MSDGDGLREVTWLGVPTGTLLATLRHLEDLTHELRLIESGARSGMVEVPPTLAATIHDIIVRYEAPQQETWRQILDAERSGCDRLDLRLRLPPNAAEELCRLVELLENADELARAGVLMTMPATEEIAALRRWNCAEAERQLVDGAEPIPHP